MFGSDNSAKVRIVFQDGNRDGIVFGHITARDEHFISFRTEAGKDMEIGIRFIHKIEPVGGG